MKKNLFVLFLIGAISFSYSQGAWVKSKGEIYTQLAFNDISNYTSIFNKNGDDLYPTRAITDRTLQWYTEYGVTNNLTVVASIPYKLLKTGDLVEENIRPVTIVEGNYSAFGNIGLAARYKLPSKKLAIAAQLQLELLTSGFNRPTGLRSGVDAYTITPTLAIGKGSNDLFFQSYTGVFLRTNDYSNGFRFYVEGGKHFFNQLWVVAFIDIVDSFEDGNVITPVENLETFLQLNNSEYAGFGFKLIEELSSNFGITAALGGAFSAHLEAKKASLNVGAYYKFNVNSPSN